MLGAGSELGHYRIVRRLGKGGMAEVYEAEDLNLGRHVALKVLPQELTRDPQMVARFRTEVRSAAGMNHRNIVTVFEVGEHEGMQFYAMRLLTGGDLRDRIGDGMRATEALAILKELAGAFEHAHSRGFVHRDMKPENVMFDDEGVPVLTDFGISKALGGGSQMTATGVVIGTPRYFSPEQARGRPVDARSDLYSLGVTFFEMLTGQPPYDGKDIISVVQQHVNDPVPELPRKHAQLQPLIDQMMAKNPDQRIASAKALRMAIAEIGAPGPARASAADEEPEAQEPEERPRSSSMAATRLVRQLEPESEAEPESVPAPWETESEPQQLADDDAPIDLGVPQPGLIESQQFPAQDETRRSPWLFVAAGAALMIVSAAATWFVVSKKSAPEPTPQVPAAPAAQVAAPPPPASAPAQPEAVQAAPAAAPAVVEAPAPTPAAPVPAPAAAPTAAPVASPVAKPPKAAKSAPSPSRATPAPAAQPAAESAPAPASPPAAEPAAPAVEPEPARSAAPEPAPAAEPAPAPAPTPEQAAPPPIEAPPSAKPEPAPAEPAVEPKSGEELDEKPDAPAPAP